MDVPWPRLSPRGNTEKGAGSASPVRNPGTGTAEGKVAKLIFPIWDVSYIGKLMGFRRNFCVRPLVAMCVRVGTLGAQGLGEQEACLNRTFSNYII